MTTPLNSDRQAIAKEAGEKIAQAADKMPTLEGTSGNLPPEQRPQPQPKAPDEPQRLDPKVAPVNQPGQASSGNTPKDQTPEQPKAPLLKEGGQPETRSLGKLKITELHDQKGDVEEGTWITLPGGACLALYKSKSQGLVLAVHQNTNEDPRAADLAIAFTGGSVFLQTTSHGETLATDLHNVVKRFASVVPTNTPPVPTST